MQNILWEFNQFCACIKIGKKSEIEFYNEILRKIEKIINTLSLFKEHTCSVKAEDAKNTL